MLAATLTVTAMLTTARTIAVLTATLAMLAAAGTGSVAVTAARMARPYVEVEPRPRGPERFAEPYRQFVAELHRRGSIGAGLLAAATAEPTTAPAGSTDAGSAAETTAEARTAGARSAAETTAGTESAGETTAGTESAAAPRAGAAATAETSGALPVGRRAVAGTPIAGKGHA